MATTTSPEIVNTAKVGGRREIHYRNHDEVVADAERLAAGGYRSLGNWSLGQVTAHLAMAMNTGLDGPPGYAPWPFRFVARMFIKNRIMRGPMKPGFQLPPKFSAALLPKATTDSDGLEALRTAVRRWKSESQRHPHGFFGQLTPDEWDQLMLRHAEMHMSFQVPQ